MQLRQFSISDVEIVDNLLRQDDIYQYLADDNSPPREDFSSRGLLSDEVSYLIGAIDNKGKAICVFIYSPINSICYQQHSAIRNDYRGHEGLVLGKAAHKWMFSYTNAEKLIGFCPADNRQIIAFGKKLGAREEGLITNSFLRNRTLIDQVILGVTKEEFIKCQQQ